MAAPVYYTADQARALPDDGNRYDVVHGELLVTPSPRAWHQEIAGRVYHRLTDYLRAERVGHALLSPADISWATRSCSRTSLSSPSRTRARWTGPG